MDYQRLDKAEPRGPGEYRDVPAACRPQKPEEGLALWLGPAKGVMLRIVGSSRFAEPAAALTGEPAGCARGQKTYENNHR